MSKELKFSRLFLPKEEVNALPAAQKNRFLMLTNMLRDMDLFRKLLVYCSKQKTGHEKLDETALVTMSFSFLKILIGKVYEIWQFLDHEEIEKEKTYFSHLLSEQWDVVKSFFKEKKNNDLFSFVRNKFGFHFGHDPDLESRIDKAVAETGDMEFWFGEDSSGNDIFASSNTVMLTVLCDKMRELGFVGEEEDLINQLQKLPIDISHGINEFCKAYLVEILLRKNVFTVKETITVVAPSWSEIHLPLITSNDMSVDRTPSEGRH